LDRRCPVGCAASRASKECSCSTGPARRSGLTFWEGREVAERALPLRMQFLERIATVASVQIDEIESFDVAAAQPVSRQAD